MKGENAPNTPVKVFTQEGVLNRIINRIRKSLELDEILTTTALEVRLFLDIERVKIYRFHPDGSGEVIAESIHEQRLPSLLGLNFPADDIPPHTREMFVKARQRVIVDVASQRKALNQLDSVDTGEGLSVEDIRYSPLDSCHAEYLAVMGVCSSLTVPIVHQNKLWGLLACHHSQPRHFSERKLKIVQMLVDQVSIAIAQSNLLDQTRQQVQHEATLNRISCLLHSLLNVGEIRQRIVEESVKALQGSGGRLYITAEPTTGQPHQLFKYAEQPILPLIEETHFWQKTMGFPKDVSQKSDDWSEAGDKASGLPAQSFDSNLSGEQAVVREESIHPQANNPNRDFDSFNNKDNISGLCIVNDIYQAEQNKFLVPAFKPTAIRSILIVPLHYRHRCVGCLTIFRNEIKTETCWAGCFNTDERNIRPRDSFEAYREIKTGQAEAWRQDEIKLARALGQHIYMAVMQRRVEEMLRHQASHDSLTGLPNRMLFDDRLSLALAHAHRRGEMLAVVFLDLDRFKTINDTLGHAVGDELLQSAAQRLKSCLRSGDTIARWGGDEFTLLLPQITCVQDAAKIAEKILVTLRTPFQLKEHELHITTSIGVALAPYDGEDAETLLKKADTAMYHAKQKGKNNFQLYVSTMNTQALEQLVLANSLYKALNRNELVLHYQPQVDLKTGQIIGIEALIRWQHPVLGLLPPNQFVPVAEETGLIDSIGEWVLETACAQNRAWQLAGLPPVRIAVNLSARQFQQQNFVKKIVYVLAKTGLDPHYLDLEITESFAMQNVDFTISVLQALQEMGIQISMDDFGTGYSSLAALQQFPLHILKIDQVFINNSTTNAKGAALVKAIVALGHGLNLKVVAEGVETAEQFEFLRAIKCDGIQGYFFSRPLPAEAAAQLCLEQSISSQNN